MIPSPARPRPLDVVLGAVALVLLATTMGVLFNHFQPRPLPLLAPYRPALPPGVYAVSTAEGRALWSLGRVVFVDAREAERYAEGHIPGALSLPYEDAQQDPPPPEILERLRRAPMVILYCDGPECRASERLALRLGQLGLRHLRVYVDGWPAWEAAGYPVSRGKTP